MPSKISDHLPRPIVRKSSAADASKSSVRWKGRTLPLYRERGIWRIKSRQKGAVIDASLQTGDLETAKRMARTLLERRPPSESEQCRGSLEEAVQAYLTMPKRCSDKSAGFYVARLRGVVRAAWGVELSAVPVLRLPGLWSDYVAKRQGREVADYSSRLRQNIGINSAMQAAASVFRKKLHRLYREKGIVFPPDALAIEWLPRVTAPRSKCDDKALVRAWEKLARTDRDLWLAIGLARFAGLRRNEIMECRGSWIVKRKHGAVVELRDREEEGVRTKTGGVYSAPILHAGLAKYLLALKPDAKVINRRNPLGWMQTEPQRWAKQFTGGSKMPLHRLRGLYADEYKKLHEDAILARQAGIKAASKALGHTSVRTTEDHYLSGE